MLSRVEVAEPNKHFCCRATCRACIYTHTWSFHCLREGASLCVSMAAAYSRLVYSTSRTLAGWSQGWCINPQDLQGAGVCVRACVCEREYKVQTGALPCISPHTFRNTPEILSGRILMPDKNTSATLLNETARCFNPKAFFSKGLRVVVSGFWKTDAWFSILSTEP